MCANMVHAGRLLMSAWCCWLICNMTAWLCDRYSFRCMRALCCRGHPFVTNAMESCCSMCVEGAHCLQDDTLRGLLHGIYVGVSGILLKPLSGSLSLLSELCMGASGRIRTWGEEFHRGPPITRARPPRQFSALTTDMRGTGPAPSLEALLNVCLYD